MKQFYILFSLILATSFSQLNAEILYVKPGAASTSWQNQTNVYSDLQTALTDALAGDEVWVAAGIYKPTTDGNRDISFDLKDGVEYYGGFVGSETELSQRNWRDNETILSGDIGVEIIRTDNSYHVVKLVGSAGAPITEATLIDGIIIEKGYTDYSANINDGGGMLLTFASPIVRNVWFRNNYASDDGGAIYSDGDSNARFGNVIFTENVSGDDGGAVYSVSSLNFFNCTWNGNMAKRVGGAVYGNCIIKNSISWGNFAGNYNNEFTYEPGVSNSIYSTRVLTNGVISEDPMFAAPGKFDFRLLQGSPGINMGNNEDVPHWLPVDYFGQERIQDGTVNVGAVEEWCVAPQLISPADQVYLESDVSEVTLEWGWSESIPDGVESYALEYQINDEEIQLVDNLQSLNHTLSGLTPASNVTWRVFSLDQSGTKTWSKQQRFSVLRGHPLFVTADGTGSGSSWADAMSMQEAISISVNGDSIWAAKGIYTPTETTDRNVSFVLKENVKIFGGFSGTETEFNERNWIVNETILSGDIGEVGVNTDNSFHVLMSIGDTKNPITGNTVINGVIIENGYADDSNNANGGGLYLEWASPIIQKVSFRNNYASKNGGAVYDLVGSQAEFGNVFFIENSSGSDGGAVYANKLLRFYNCIWFKNSAYYGGGGVDGRNRIENSIFWENTTLNGGDIDLGYPSLVSNSIFIGTNGANDNISANPDFIDVDNLDFRLREGSPAINAGNTDITPDWLIDDYFGSARVLGDTIDIGIAEGGVIVPSLVSPGNGSVHKGVDEQLVFEWTIDASVSDNISSYQLEYIVNNDTTLIDNIATQQYELSGFMPLDSVGWRVGYVDENGYSNWSSRSSFFIFRGHPLHVVPGGSGDGSSWVNGIDLKDALQTAVGGDSLWIAKGTYKPTETTERDASFVLRNNVKLFGGFSGDETSFNERDWNVNHAVLSGDIGEVGVDSDNSFNVVRATGTQTNPLSGYTVLDGVVIEKGYADTYNHNDGGGMLMQWASPIVKNVWFRNNYASDDGGAVYGDSQSKAQFGNVIFRENESGDDGGAVYAHGNFKFYNCVWYDNYAGYYGGAVYANYASVINSIAWGNSAGNNYDSFSYGLTVTNSIFNNAVSANDNISANPEFIDVDNSDFRLREGSPAINAGNSEVIPEWLNDDYFGNTRILGDTIDIGIAEGGVIIPLLLSPGNGSFHQVKADEQLVFEWTIDASVSENISAYQLEYIVNSDTTLIDNVSGQQHLLSGFFPLDSIEWRVGYLDEKGYSNWSSKSSFGIYREHPLYVIPGGNGSGSSWADGIDLKDALQTAVGGDSLWIAKGTYKPTETTERDASFVLRNNVKLFGGFSGDETSFNERDWNVNHAVLSGDIGEVGVDSDNSFNVVRATGTQANPLSGYTVLDGVVIEKGYADTYGSDDGGGMMIEWASPIVRNVWFRNNYASDYGGAVFGNSESQAQFGNVIFTENESDKRGGAVYAAGNLRFYNCVWYENLSGFWGGAVYGNSASIINSVAWESSSKHNNSVFSNGLTVTNSIFSNAGSSNGNISLNPGFVASDKSDFRLIEGSPGINAGNTEVIPDWLIEDYFGSVRILGDTIDIGIAEGGVIVPSLVSPGNGSVNVVSEDEELFFEWTIDARVSEDISTYQFECIVNGSDTTLIDNIAAQQYQHSGFMPLDSVEWRICYTDEKGYSNWSSKSSFHIYRGHPIYVVPGGIGDGSDWENAIDLKEALKRTVDGDSLWVAKGTYKPTETSNREASFVLPENVKLFGGFAGTETSFEERNRITNQVILSGDIGEEGINVDNSYNVVKIIGNQAGRISDKTILDGVVIENGYADESNNNDGGGMLMQLASPIVKNVWFRNNYASDRGGAVYCTDSKSHAQFGNVIFSENESGGYGGAVYAYGILKFYNCLWYDNYSGFWGGAVYGALASVTNSIAWENSAKYNADNFSGGIIVTNSIFSDAGYSDGNISQNPEFIAAETSDFRLKRESPAINAGNTEAIPGWLIKDYFGSPRILDDVIDIGVAEGGVIVPSLLSPGNGSVKQVREDEQLVLEWTIDASVAEDISFYQLEYVVNNDTTLLENIVAQQYELGGFMPLDSVEWRVGFIDENGYSNWSSRSSFSIYRDHPLYVVPGGSGDGSSWANAIGLKDALQMAVNGDSIWVSKGIYKPTETTDRNASFVINDHVKLFGGFAGTETSFDERNRIIHPVILSGDIGETGVDTDNSYHVVKMVGSQESPISQNTVLDGVIIENGYADESNNDGGGMLMQWASPIVKNVWFRNNYASDNGGAVYGDGKSDAQFGNAIFSGNGSGYDGGAVCAYGNVKFYNCVWYDNSSGHWGGAVYGNLVSVTNSIAWENSGSFIYNVFSNGLTVTNSIFNNAVGSDGNISQNPEFIDGDDSDFRLKPGSPAINAGNTETIPDWLIEDYFGSGRVLNDTIDIGVAEGGVIVPSLLSPENGSVKQVREDEQLLFEWTIDASVAEDISAYHLEYIVNTDTLLIDNIADQQYALDGLMPLNDVEWRVGYTDKNGYDNWSLRSSFSIHRGHPVYVVPGGTGDGSSWTNAMDLDDALQIAVKNDSIWIAEGIYKPTETNDRNASFVINDQVKLFGGFAGTETSFDERNRIMHPVILSGDIGEAGVDTDNSYHVVKFVGNQESPISQNTVLDGVVIENGYADEINNNDDGGGMLMQWASPIVKNVWFRNNYASDDGGAVVGDSESHAQFGNVIFSENESGDDGGAVYAFGNFKFYNCVWYDNYSGYWGGAVYGNSALVTNSIAWENSARYNHDTFSNGLTVTNSIFSNALSSDGNLSQDPGFIAVGDSDFRLNPGSPAINAGSSENLPSWMITDYYGYSRIQGEAIDIGVAEGGIFVPSLLSPETGSVKQVREDEQLLFEWTIDASVAEDISAYRIEYIVNDSDTTLIDNISGLQHHISGFMSVDSVVWRVGYIDEQGYSNWSSKSSFCIFRGGPLYVVPGGTGDGSSWANAADLKEALQRTLDGDSIWIAKGTYKPTETSDRDASFVLPENVKLFGGFAGTETLFEERNLIVNQVILSGDIGEQGINSDNSYNVVAISGTQTNPITEETVLDGVIIENGYAHASNNNDGGGMLMQWASPIVKNVWFRNNYASDDGGAVFGNSESHAQFGNVIFSENESGDDGGAVYAYGNFKFYNCVWYDNYSGYWGGAVYGNSSSVTNSIAWENSSRYNYDVFSDGTMVTNSIFNNAGSSNGNLSQNPEFLSVEDSDFRLKEGSPAINAGISENLPAWMITDYYGLSRIQGDTVDLGIAEGWVISPILVAPADNSYFEADVTGVSLEWGWDGSVPDNINGYEVEYAINEGEPKFMDGLSSVETIIGDLSPADVVTWRICSVEESGIRNWTDRRKFTVYRDHPLYVKPGARGNGTSWLNAIDLKDALNMAIKNDEIWVASGTYKPTDGLDRVIAFELEEGIKLYGGFGGFESSVDERNWLANETILSGDIGVNGEAMDNTHNVLRIRGSEEQFISEETVVDGFIIENGNSKYDGGGIYILWASPKLSNLWLRNNRAARWGGAVYSYAENDDCSPSFSNVLFVNNSASSAGAAVMAFSDVSFSSCLWYGNVTPDNAGAVFKSTGKSIQINNSIAWNNESTSDLDFNFSDGIQNSIYADAGDSNGNITEDPLFINPANNIFHLRKTSPAINAGDNDLVPESLLFDFAGFNRIYGDNVDIGPFEHVHIENVSPGPMGSATKEYNMLMMLDLSWGITDGIMEPQLNIPSEFDYQLKLWKEGDEENLIEEGPFSARSDISGSNNSTTIGNLEHDAGYQWSIGLDYGNYVVWSDPTAFYIGHDHSIHVKDGSNGTTGSSWADAFGTLTEAIDYAIPGDEIWVAGGTYYPVTPADAGNVTQAEREQALSLKPGLVIYGGLAGNESNAWNRNHVENKTILSGDIGVAGDDSDNSINLIRNEFDASSPLQNGAVIEGFIFEDATGSAIYNVNASPSVEYSIFRNNEGVNGGAVYNENSSPHFFNVLFHNNVASQHGGAVYADEGSKPELLSCTVTDNSAANTGGLSGEYVVRNSIVYGNEGTQFSDENSSVIYSCVEGGYDGEENISYDPLWTDPASDDFTLQEFSPCIDQGNQSFFAELFSYDLAKKSRSHWLETDMGAFEVQDIGELQVLETSINVDSPIGFIDSMTIRFNQPIAVDPAIAPGFIPDVESVVKVWEKDNTVLIISHPGLQASADYHLEIPGGQVTLANNDKIRQSFLEYDFTTRACVPVVVSVQNPDVMVCPRTSATLEMDVEGDVLDYSWIFNDQETVSQNVDSLALESVMPENLGIYTLLASDWCGSSDEVSVNLQYKTATELVIPEPKWKTVYFVDNSSGKLSDFKWFVDSVEVSDKQYLETRSTGISNLYVTAFDEVSQCVLYGEVGQIKFASLKSATVSPNPVAAGNTVNVWLPEMSEKSRIRLYDMRGALLIDQQFGQSDFLQLEDTQFKSGVYLLYIEYDDGYTEEKKLVIE